MSSLLEKIFDAHGGMENWNKFRTISPTLRFGGLAFRSRFNLAGLIERRVEIFTRRPFVIFNDFPKKGMTGTFTPNEVYIEKAGLVIRSREQPRSYFDSLRRKIFWDDLDLLYFAGYASWNYFNSPFLLGYPGVTVEELSPLPENGKLWRRLRAHFPDQFPTHCNSQIFYFDEKFRMVRLDYCPEIFASWARAAHFCSHHSRWNEILIPSRRRVVVNKPYATAKSLPTLVWIDVKNVIFY